MKIFDLFSGCGGFRLAAMLNGIRDFLLKLAYGQIEAHEAQKIASELYIRSITNDR